MVNHTPMPWILKADSQCRVRGQAYNILATATSRKLLQWRAANPDKRQDTFSGVTVASLAMHWNGSGEPFGPTDGLIGPDELLENGKVLRAAPELLTACHNIYARELSKPPEQRDDVICSMAWYGMAAAEQGAE